MSDYLFPPQATFNLAGGPIPDLWFPGNPDVRNQTFKLNWNEVPISKLYVGEQMGYGDGWLLECLAYMRRLRKAEVENWSKDPQKRKF